MLKQEWKSLFHNKILLLVVIVIALIPAIYAGLFLASMWDPYGNVDKLPVAIVNEDEPAEYGDTTLTVGDQLVDNLKENDSLAFNFVDADVAKEGLKNGTYYMVITIPKDFSANAATVMDDQPEKMILNYETNPGTNYIASKLSETALGKIKTSIREEVTKTYAEAIFDQIGTAGDGMQEAADGAKKIKDGMDDASDGNKKITDNLKVLADSTLTFKEGSEELTEGLKSYTDGVAQVNDGAKQLDDGVSTLTASLPTLTNGVDRLNSGVKEYTDGVATLNSNSEALNSGSKQLAEGSEQLAAGAKQLSGLENIGQVYAGIVNLNNAVTGADKTGTLQNGTAQLAAGLEQISKSVSTLEHSASAEQLAKLSQGLGSAVSGIQNASSSVTEATGIVNKAATGISNMQENVANALSGYAKIAESAANDGNSKIQTANTKLQSASATMTSAAQQLSACTKQDDGSIVIDAQMLNNLVSTLNSAAANTGSVDTVNTEAYVSKANSTTTAITSGMAEANESLSAAAVGLEQYATGLTAGANSLAAGAKDLQDQTKDLSTDSIKQLSAALQSASVGAANVNKGVSQVSAGLTQLQNATSSFPAAAEGMKTLDAGIETLAAGAQTLNTGLTAYTAGVSTLNNNSAALTSGTQQLADGAKTLGSGATTLANGTSTLYNGTKTLVANNSKLNSGAAQLTDGAGQIQDGSSQLYDGSKELGDGLKKLDDGSDTLQSSLADGAETVKENKAEDVNYEMIAAPVDDDEAKMTEVPNNGHAMAPYMMSVGLWVGALAFCLMYPLTKYNGKLKSGFAWWGSKASVLYPLALLQGVLVIFLLHVFDGFTPAQMGKAVAFACLTSVAFTSIMYFFNISLGKVGSFLMLVFMVIQLAGSAGTYPVQLSPAFVSKIHAWVPFTYSVDAFRSVICAGESIRTPVIVMCVITIVFTILTIIEFQFRTRRIKAGKPIFHDFLEEKGLA